MTVLDIRQLSRALPAKTIVDAVSFEASRGEALAIVGPSGAGKSSLLRLINRLDEPTGGTVYVNGEDYRGIPARDLRRSVGMVMQRPFVFPGSVAANVGYGPRQQDRAIPPGDIERLLERMGLPGFADRDAGNLSGGEAQRVCLARALANQPRALLLDEPTSALDESSRRQIEAIVLQVIREDGLTCIWVTHDLAQAGRIADRVAVMQRGALRRIGPAREVLSEMSNAETTL